MITLEDRVRQIRPEYLGVDPQLACELIESRV
jgi:hypothetical protein